MISTVYERSPFRSNMYVVWNEFKKNIKFLMAYPVIFVFWAVFPIFWFIPFILQGQAFVGGLESANFGLVAGTTEFVPFIVIGAILNSYVNTLLYGVGESIRREAIQGTLDYVFAAPTNKAFVLIGKALSESVSSTMFAASQLTISVILFGMTITVGVLLPVFLIVILLILGLYGLSLVLAAVSLLYKQSHDVSETIGYVFYVFSPVRYPIESLPSWAQVVGKLIPLTYALIIVRSIMLIGTPLSAMYFEVLMLLIIDAVLILAGFYMFNWMENKTKRSGTISHF
ncbi:MAG: ABC transporter permease [Candidatus Bathyarchaeota archaeon]|nr:ABC transporter permease [Candidatus Bathyarchaeum tardum]WNZ28619.1 MAG: ABC transporter permease [Candidatus Bathyarchaeota archaeon]